MEFLRRRRDLEVTPLPRLGVPYLQVDVSAGHREANRREITGFLSAHLAEAGAAPFRVANVRVNILRADRCDGVTG